MSELRIEDIDFDRLIKRLRRTKRTEHLCNAIDMWLLDTKFVDSFTETLEFAEEVVEVLIDLNIVKWSSVTEYSETNKLWYFVDEGLHNRKR